MSYDGWKSRTDRDERPELPDYRTCFSPDCQKREVVQAVDPSDDECPMCGAPWGTTLTIHCANCHKNSFISDESSADEAQTCTHCRCPYGYAGLREGSDY